MIRDRRRIDPVTGKVREPRERAAAEPAGQPAAAPGTPGAPNGTPAQTDDQSSELEAKLAERTSDLQRLQAEYVNYKRRVDRDREVARDSAVANVVAQLLPVLDDIGRAREHGELEGGFKAVAESLERVVGGLGLVRFADTGDRFDPRIHEALMHSYSDQVSEPTAGMILAPGYRIGERIVRPARVAVIEPEPVTAQDTSLDESITAETYVGDDRADGEVGDAGESNEQQG